MVSVMGVLFVKCRFAVVPWSGFISVTVQVHITSMKGINSVGNFRLSPIWQITVRPRPSGHEVSNTLRMGANITPRLFDDFLTFWRLYLKNLGAIYIWKKKFKKWEKISFLQFSPFSSHFFEITISNEIVDFKIPHNWMPSEFENYQ